MLTILVPYILGPSLHKKKTVHNMADVRTGPRGRNHHDYHHRHHLHHHPKKRPGQEALLDVKEILIHLILFRGFKSHQHIFSYSPFPISS